MKIEHVAIWTFQLETLKDFYTIYFGGQAGDKYHNTRTGFESYFLTFEEGARLELMQWSADRLAERIDTRDRVGYAHLAFAVGSQAAVDHLTEQLRTAGYTIASEPRTTGDGYYESVVLDPDGNRVEITI